MAEEKSPTAIAIEAIRRDEREACAKICEGFGKMFAEESNPLYRQITEHLARIIRERETNHV